MLQLHDAKHFRFDGELKEDWLLVNTTNDTTFSIGRKKSIQTEDGVLQMAYGSGDGTPYRCSFSYSVAE